MLCLPTAGLLAQGQYDLDPLPPFPDHVQYTHYNDQIGKGLAGSPRSGCSDVPGSARDRTGHADGNSGGWSLAQEGTCLPQGLGD